MTEQPASPRCASALKRVEHGLETFLFNSRCPFAIERCRRERPVLQTLRPDQRAACHRSDEISGFAAC